MYISGTQLASLGHSVLYLSSTENRRALSAVLRLSCPSVRPTFV